MLRSLEGGSGPVVTSGESGNEYQYCEAEAGSAGDTATACLVSEAYDEAAQASAAVSVDPGSAEGRDTAELEDGDLSQAEPCADTRDGDTDQDQAVTELVEDSVQEAKFPHPPPSPSPPPADTPAPSVSSFIVTIGLRKMCKICGMQVSENIFGIQC